MNTDITSESSLGTVGTDLSPGAIMPGANVSRSANPSANSQSDSAARRQQLNSSIIEDPTDTGAIEFRVSRENETRRRLRLTGQRYTFGNADGCTIRLNDPDLRPMHAVLIRETAQVVVRAYSIPVEVNGAKVTEATLEVGDVLRIGLYEFELLSQSDSIQSKSRSLGSISPHTAPLHRDLPSTDDVVWRERLRREVEQWRLRQEECDRRENRIDERESELRSRESELWSRSDNLHRRETRIQSQEAETFHLYDVFAQRQQELLKLREESQDRQEALRRRELEFREQELEYRRRLAEATAQLDQSRLQADSATQAVARMREQFDALHAQIEQLSQEQQEIEARETQQSEANQRMRDELESAKAEAEQARSDSERQCRAAEARVADLESEIEAIREAGGIDVEQQHAELAESKRIADQLRDQVSELQKAVADASEESSHLRADFEQASAKVQELEQLVSESQHRGDANRDQWATETEQLRADVERLSDDLSEANKQLAEVRAANESLNQRLREIRQERDDARVERDARPTTDAYQALREELDQANDQLAEIKKQYDESLAKLADDSDSDITDVIPAALGLAVAGDGSAPDVDQENVDAGDNLQPYQTGETISESSRTDDGIDRTSQVDDDDDPWPMYQSAADVADSSQSTTDSPPADIDSNSDAIGDEPDTAPLWKSFVQSQESPEAGTPDASGQGAAEPAAAGDTDAADTDAADTDAEAIELESSHRVGSEPDRSTETQIGGPADPLIDTRGVNSVGADDDIDWPAAVIGDLESAKTDWNLSPESSADAVADRDASPSTENIWGSIDEASVRSAEDPSGSVWNDSDLGDTDAAEPQPTGPQVSGLDTGRFGMPVSDIWNSDAANSDPMDSDAVSSDAVSSDVGESIAAGSLADALIQDFQNEQALASDLWKSDADADRPSASEQAADAEGHHRSVFHFDDDASAVGEATPDAVSAGELGIGFGSEMDSAEDALEDREEEIHEGTMLISDAPSGSRWSPPQDVDDSQLGSTSFDDLGDSDGAQAASPWDEVTERSHDFLDSDDSDDDMQMDSAAIYGGQAVATPENDSPEMHDVTAANPVSEAMGEPAGDLAPSDLAPSDLAQDGSGQDDDSIEAYMNRLLRRVQGDDHSAADAAMPETISVSTSQSTFQPSPSLSQSSATESSATSSAPIDINAPLVPRSQAPERGGNLSAMRDLANSSARSAISRSARVQSRDTQIQAMVSFACATGALACNVFAFYFLSGVLLVVAVSMTFVVALICIREGLHLLGEARRRIQSTSVSDEKLVADVDTDLE